jgi:hypothetical protein
VTQAIATAPQRPFPRGDRAPATAAMAGMAHANPPKSGCFACRLPACCPWGRCCCGLGSRTVSGDLQPVLAHQAAGQEGAGARLLQVRRGAHGHQLADLLRRPIRRRCAVDHDPPMSLISLASLCQHE